MSELETVILAEGDEARRKVEEKTVKREKMTYVKLKDGEQLRGFLLTTNFVMYYNHGDFEKRIKSHPCSDPKHGKSCISCANGVKRVKKTIVPFFNVDTKQVEIFDASSKNMKAIYTYVDEYGDEATTTPISLKRSGGDQTTVYSLMPVRVKPAEKDVFVVPDGITIDRDFYASILQAPSEDYVRELLGLAAGTSPTSESSESALPDIKDDDLPF